MPHAARLAQRLLRRRERAPSRHALDDAALTERIRRIHAASDATYGMPRVRAELLDEGVRVSRKRVARLMRRAGLRGAVVVGTSW